MQNNKAKLQNDSELRNRSEEILADDPEEIRTTPPEHTDGLIHELQVHQIELELQNEELRKTHLELELSHRKYFDLFDLAPVGYFTLDEKALIQEANFTGSELLGANDAYVIGKKFTDFIASDSQDIFYLHSKEVSSNHEKKTCELKLKRKDGSEFNAELICMPWRDTEGNITQLLIAVTDKQREFSTLHIEPPCPSVKP